jgi:hypothetical protein
VQELSIRDFLLGKLPAQKLEAEVASSLRQVDAVTHQVEIEDMSDDFRIEPAMLIRLCDATASGQISGDALKHIAFAIIASDHFKWANSIVGEVVHDWAAPEINYPLTPDNMGRFRQWLVGDVPYPRKPGGRNPERL